LGDAADGRHGQAAVAIRDFQSRAATRISFWRDVRRWGQDFGEPGLRINFVIVYGSLFDLMTFLLGVFSASIDR
jgi:hypothetical protein